MPPNHALAPLQLMTLVHIKGSDTTVATTCSTDRDSVITRSPSPIDFVDHHQVQVIMEELKDANLSNTTSSLVVPTDNRRTSRSRGGLNLKKKSSSLLKSFTSSSASHRGSNISSGGGSFSMGEEDSSHSFGSSSENLSRLVIELGKTDEDGDEDSDMNSTDHGDSTPSSQPQPSENGNIDKLPKRWVQRSKSQRGLKKGSNLLASFTRKKSTNNNTNHSSHPISLTPGGSHLSNLLEEEDTEPLRPNSDHDGTLTEMLQANGRDGHTSTADVARMLQEGMNNNQSHSRAASTGVMYEGGGGHTPSPFGQVDRRLSSTNSSFTSTGSYSVNNELDLSNSLDLRLDRIMDSNAMLESLGDNPSSHDLANVAAIRAKEYIEECLSADVSVLDRKKWESIPQFTKADLVVGQHLGKGTFSDAFEVFTTIVEEEASPTLESLGSDRADLDRLIEAKFRSKPSVGTVDEGDEELAKSTRSDNGCVLDKEIEAMFGKKAGEGGELDKPSSESSGDDLDKEIDTMFDKKEASGDDLDNEIDAMFGGVSPKNAPAVIQEETVKEQKQEEDAKKPTEFQPQAIRRQTRSLKRRTHDLGGSVCLGTTSRQTSRKRQERKVVLAMKCLRPQIRSNAEQFMIGVEDLVHETAMLASLDHPNIIKIHGRAGGCVSSSFRLSDGFFILLDRLKDTLDDRIVRWKKMSSNKKAPPSLSQIKTACSLADAMSYLHSKNIVFRDLKPANVGFDSMGTLKLFDFGFAIGVDEPVYKSSSVYSGCSSRDESEDDGLLYDKCGTPRYMAPEVGLELGYSLPADVYSFGILLWEICALKKPFGNVKSADEFHKTVFEKGARPKLGKYWSQTLKDLMTNCWSTDSTERHTMSHVKSMLAAHTREVSMQQNKGQNNLRKSSVFRRFTG